MTAQPRNWRASAVCAQVDDPEQFFPIDTGPAGAAAVACAKKVCASCPVRTECLTDVMASEDPAERWGVVGGLSAQDRTALHLNQRQPAPLVALVPTASGVQLGLFDLTRSAHGAVA